MHRSVQLLRSHTHTYNRYQEEEKERLQVLERQRVEAEQLKRKEKLEVEAELRDRLMKNVQHLEERKRVIERELKLRNISSETSQLKSAIVVPHTSSKNST